MPNLRRGPAARRLLRLPFMARIVQASISASAITRPGRCWVALRQRCNVKTVLKRRLCRPVSWRRSGAGWAIGAGIGHTRIPAVATRRQGPILAVAIRRQGPILAVATRRQGPILAVATRRQGPILAVAIRRQGQIRATAARRRDLRPPLADRSRRCHGGLIRTTHTKIMNSWRSSCSTTSQPSKTLKTQVTSALTAFTRWPIKDGPTTPQ